MFNPLDGAVGLANLDTDGDGVANMFDLDSDNDGIPDLVEVGGSDTNHDGRADVFADTNANGYADVYDPAAFGIAVTTTGADTNNDGRPESYIEDNDEGKARPNYVDLDSDDDGILDVREAGLTDSDYNGVADGTPGADGWSDAIDALTSLNLPNTDGKSKPDYLDIDSDNDGIVDNIEAQSTSTYVAPAGTDGDQDGIDDAYDNNDTAFAGGINNGLAPVNTEGMDKPDYTDTDTDNDQLTDILEGWDTNKNGIIDGSEKTGGTTDGDADGLLDGFDANMTAVNPTNATTPVSYPGNTPTTERYWRQNLPPTPVNDTGTATEDQTLTGTSLLANDTDPEGNTLTISTTPVTAPTSGTLVINSNGTYTYTPNANFNGTDGFVYRVCESKSGMPSQCATATVSITVTAVNDAPVANNDNATVTEDSQVVINVPGNDTDDGSLDLTSVVVTVSPVTGTVTVNPTTGEITYTPNANVNGSDSFQYTIKDNSGATSNVATVSITITPVNDAPGSGQ